MRTRRSHAWRAALGLALALMHGLLLPAPGQARGGKTTLAPQARHVRRLLAEWRLAEAERAVAPLQRIAPDDPAVRLAGAEVLFHRGRYGDALKLLDRLPGGKAKPPWTHAGHLRALVRSTAKTVKGYHEQRSSGGHFIVRASGRDRLLAPFVGETLEAARARVAKDLGFVPPHPIIVEIYPRTTDLARVSPLTEQDIRRSGTIALCKYQRLMIVSPRALLRGYPWRDTLAHEYTHLVVSSVSHNSVPIWLHEGLAKHFEARWRLPPSQQPPLTPIQRQLLAQALAKRSLIPWRKMHPSMAKLPDQRSTALAFAQVQTAVSFIARRGGIKGLKGLLLAMRAGKSDWAAIRAVTGLDRRAFTAGWKRYLRGLGLSQRRGLALRGLVFNKRKSREKRIAALKEAKVRRHFRLADMLRRRGLVRASVLQYEKARAAGGQRESMLGNALARAYLELSMPRRAIAVLRPVIEYYPELAGVQATLGAAHLAVGDAAAAARHLDVALRISPFNPQLHCDLAKALPTTEATRRARHARLCKTLAKR
jgi:tetratricopeptide (TPR) repeat protein